MKLFSSFWLNKLEESCTWVGSWPCPQRPGPGWKGLPLTKHSSLFGQLVIYEEKKVFDIDTFLADGQML
jgi:hypothetical protein